jgi:hypothetical protein
MSHHIINNKKIISDFKYYISTISSDNIIYIEDIPDIMFYIIKSIDEQYPNIYANENKIELLNELSSYLIKTYCTVEIFTEDKIIENINKIILLIQKCNNPEKKCCVII